ncbi:MAG: ABC transporter ATP-binding protein [Ardenticatenia bacterium]|nr:MAG: ABC transporter ATP-binding protein [Ardenticatenia bacterium]
MTTATLSHASEFNIPTPYETDKRSPARWLFSHARRHWVFILMAMIGAFGNAALAAAVPVLVGRAFNGILSGAEPKALLLQTGVLLVSTQGIRAILQLGRNFGAELIGQRLERDIRNELYVSLLGKSMTFHNLQPVGDTMARATNDVREINLMFNPGFNLILGSANFLFMPVLVAPRYHPSLVLVPLGFIVAYFIAVVRYLRQLQPVTTEVREAFGALNARLAEALDGIETVKGTAQEEAELSRLEALARRFRDAYVRQGEIEARFTPLLLLGLAQGLGFFHAVWLYRAGTLAIGDIVTYVGLLNLFGFPTFVSLFAYSQASTGYSAARRILELITRETNLDENVDGYAGKMRGEIEFRHVWFQYDEHQAPVLRDITFHVQPGQTVAIVGQTGAGKTTLVKLINRIYDATQGEVLVDGINVRDWNLEALRSQISMIEQDIFLFSRTIRENIAFGKPDATMEEIIAAAKAAQAHEFIMQFKDGYDTVIGERGVTLSGGQRQRLALARAFLTNPAILILDDSTSAIDSATEDKIQRAIYAASQGRTTILITHRLSQIRWADLIVVLRKGEISAIGTHEELLRTSEAYRRIFARDE